MKFPSLILVVLILFLSTESMAQITGGGESNEPSRSRNMNNSEIRSPIIAGVLSWVLAGGGQYYNHEYGKGAIFTGVYLVGIIAAVSADSPGLLIIPAAASITSIVDGVIIANKINRGEVQFSMDVSAQKLPVYARKQELVVGPKFTISF